MTERTVKLCLDATATHVVVDGTPMRRIDIDEVDDLSGFGVTVAEAKSDCAAWLVAALRASARGLVVLQDAMGSVVVLIADGPGCRGVRIAIDAGTGRAHEFGSWQVDHSLDDEIERTVHVTSGTTSIIFDSVEQTPATLDVTHHRSGRARTRP